ncbi:MAG: hypothetical protein WC728_16700 [Elusimicrobiota bacterium]
MPKRLLAAALSALIAAAPCVGPCEVLAQQVLAAGQAGQRPCHLPPLAAPVGPSLSQTPASPPALNAGLAALLPSVSKVRLDPAQPLAASALRANQDGLQAPQPLREAIALPACTVRPKPAAAQAPRSRAGSPEAPALSSLKEMTAPELIEKSGSPLAPEDSAWTAGVSFDGAVRMEIAAPVFAAKASLSRYGKGTPRLRAPGRLARLRSLPSSFLWRYTPAWALHAMAQEIQAVSLPLFSASLFGLPAALSVTGFDYLMRIAGAWGGSFLMRGHAPHRVHTYAVLGLGLAGLPLACAAALGAPPAVLFASLLLLAGARGAVYGLSRGIAEGILPRLMIGSAAPGKIELALNYAHQWFQISCIAMSMFAAVPLLGWLGGSGMVAVSSAGTVLASALYAGIELREPWRRPEQSRMPPGAGLKLLDYLPLVFLRWLHFMMYGVLATTLALGVFSSQGAAGTLLGLYNIGSWLAALGATLCLLPDRLLGRRGSTALAGAAGTAFAWSAMLGIPSLTFALGGLLGGLLTLGMNKWMAYYSQTLTPDGYRKASKWLMTASIACMIPIFAAVGAARLFPGLAAVLSIGRLLLGIAIVVTAGAVLTSLSLHPRRSAALGQSPGRVAQAGGRT